MAFSYYLVGSTTGNTYLLAPTKTLAINNATSLSISTGEPIKIQDRARQVIDIYYKGKSVRDTRKGK